MLFFALFLLFALFPMESTAGAREGLILCGTSVIGSLFPFMVISRMLVNTDAFSPDHPWIKAIGKFFHLSPCGVPALLLGMICGYPMGAKTAGDLCATKQISKEEASFLLSFCNHCGPAFAISAVGVSFFGNVETGVMLFVSHLLAGILTGRTLALFHQPENPPFTHSSIQTASLPILLVEAIKDSCLSMLQVVGVVVFFSASFGVLKATRLLSLLCSLFGGYAETVKAVLFGMLEITSGLKLLAGLPLPLLLKRCLSEGVLSFGGLSVFFQTLSFVAPLGIKTAPYLIGKVLSSLMAMGCIFLWSTAGLPVLLIATTGYLLLLSTIEKPCETVQIYCKSRPQYIGKKKPKRKGIQSPITDGKKNYQI